MNRWLWWSNPNHAIFSQRRNFQFVLFFLVTVLFPSLFHPLIGRGLFHAKKPFNLSVHWCIGAFHQFFFKGRHGAWWRLPAAVGQPRRLSFPAFEASLTPAEHRFRDLGSWCWNRTGSSQNQPSSSHTVPDLPCSVSLLWVKFVWGPAKWWLVNLPVSVLFLDRANCRQPIPLVIKWSERGDAGDAAGHHHGHNLVNPCGSRVSWYGICWSAKAQWWIAPYVRNGST